MRIGHARRSGGRGFTLVELLIVIAIIGLLVSLISAAVWKATATANRVRNQTEISQLATAVESFKQKFGIYPPSKILLGERITDYFKDGNAKTQPISPFHLDSYATLTTIFPRLDFSKAFFIDWDGNRALSPPVILEGDQCLVFFLGGIPQVDGNGRPFCSGFSTNPADPTYHVQKNGDTIPPFFEFDSTRLMVLPNQFRPASGYLSYRDTYGRVPYAYFSSYKTRNGYNRYGTASSDCDTLGVWPYAESISAAGVNAWRYLNPNTFQIISAGANGALIMKKNTGFGRGSDPNDLAQRLDPSWTPTRAGNAQANRGYADPPPPATPSGIDDQSNFYDAPLGTPAATPGS
jgi:prepilin-type N-terminal cleavage/methylation domain-containing protein